MSESPIQLPETVNELKEIVSRVQALLVSSGDDLVAVPADQRNIENTLLKLQEAQSQAAAMQTQCTFPSMVLYSTCHFTYSMLLACSKEDDGNKEMGVNLSPKKNHVVGTTLLTLIFFSHDMVLGAFAQGCS
jgi:hypothetical protein